MLSTLGDPIAAFHREILTILHWSTLREDFCTKFLDRFDPTPADEAPIRGRGRGRGGAPPRQEVRHSTVIEEKHRFRRHCREALGKWVLSQKARDAKEVSYYFPTRQSTSQPMLPILSAHSSAGPACTTYDDQLVRDLTMKCTKAARDAPSFADDVRQFIQVTYSLAERCYAAHTAIEEALAQLHAGEQAVKRLRTEGSSSSREAQFLRPIVKILHESMKTSEAQKRIAGDVVEISIDVNALATVFRSHFDTSQGSLDSLLGRVSGDLNLRFVSNLTSITVPKVAWDKLHALYGRAGFAAADATTFADAVSEAYGTDSVTVEMLRCATLAYRYEGNLATGSLQLCADETLKQILTDKGYHVVDLCASPINAFRAEETEEEGAAGDAAKGSVNFCSAFIDTDKPFGSLGSATTADLQSYMDLVRARKGNLLPHQQKFLFTLDVPYDEDLCNMLFLKLADDCLHKKVDTHAAFLLVLPLWWNLTFKHTPKLHLSTDKPEDVNRALTGAVSYMDEGFRVDYPWPKTLGESDWACFDAIFVKDSYSYFCTATNKQLSGVTATEVIGFESPSQGDGLRTILKEFYKL